MTKSRNTIEGVIGIQSLELHLVLALPITTEKATDTAAPLPGKDSGLPVAHDGAWTIVSSKLSHHPQLSQWKPLRIGQTFNNPLLYFSNFLTRNTLGDSRISQTQGKITSIRNLRATWTRLNLRKAERHNQLAARWTKLPKRPSAKPCQNARSI